LHRTPVFLLLATGFHTLLDLLLADGRTCAELLPGSCLAWNIEPKMRIGFIFEQKPLYSLMVTLYAQKNSTDRTKTFAPLT